MKELFEKAKQELKSSGDTERLSQFISSFASREERHYCAYLFAWLISSPTALKKYFSNHSLNDFTPKLNNADYTQTKIFYEYTAIRELLDFLERKVKNNSVNDLKSGLKFKIETFIFGGNNIGDIQKKKPDLVFYFPDLKTLILVEAKFEMEFDVSQIEESKRYGQVLMQLFPEDIKEVYVTGLGVNYHLKRIGKLCSNISWEMVYELMPEGNIKREVKSGLDYQKIIHPKAMSGWNLTKQ